MCCCNLRQYTLAARGLCSPWRAAVVAAPLPLLTLMMMLLLMPLLMLLLLMMLHLMLLLLLPRHAPLS
jgi:hypothetical protein